MAGIWGDGQRGGIFGAKVDPRLVAELERRAAVKRAFDEQAANLAPSRIPPREMPQPFDETLTGTIGDVVYGAPVVGPAALGLGARLGAAGQALQGKQGYSQALEDIQTGQEQFRRLNPGISGSAQNAGSSIFSPAFGASMGAQVVGNAAMGGLDAMVRGEDPRYAAGEAALAAAVPIPGAKGALKKGIRAYHGSPHDFERFDSAKIGTGEGAQAYGHGLYVAENEAVAKQYRDLLGTRSSAVGDPVARAQFWASDLGSREAAVSHLEGVLRQAESRPKNFDADDLEKTRQAIDYLKSGGDLMPKSGHMYEVDIAADPEHFLDWDKPLSEQSPQVRRGYAQAVAGDDPILRELLDESPESLQMAGLFPRSSGAQAYNTLAQSKRDIWRKQNTSPQDVPSSRQIGEWAQGASEQLREAGIPGIKYLDQGSRFKGDVVAGDGKPTGYHNIDQEVAKVHGGSWEAFKAAHPNPNQQLKSAIDELDARGGVKFNRDEGTSNYVVFPGNEHLIAILRKYGLPISAAGLAALSQLHPEEAQAVQKQRGR